MKIYNNIDCIYINKLKHKFTKCTWNSNSSDWCHKWHTMQFNKHQLKCPALPVELKNFENYFHLEKNLFFFRLCYPQVCQKGNTVLNAVHGEDVRFSCTTNSPWRKRIGWFERNGSPVLQTIPDWENVKDVLSESFSCTTNYPWRERKGWFEWKVLLYYELSLERTHRMVWEERFSRTTNYPWRESNKISPILQIVYEKRPIRWFERNISPVLKTTQREIVYDRLRENLLLL